MAPPPIISMSSASCFPCPSHCGRPWRSPPNRPSVYEVQFRARGPWLAPKNISRESGESLKKTAGYRHLEISLVPARLQEDAEEALIAVTRCVARGEPLVRCQLLASLFYEELLRQLRECRDNSDRIILGTAAAQCGRAATASATPRDLLQELRSAIATLLSAPRSPLSPGRPVLRVIQGGLSKT